MSAAAAILIVALVFLAVGYGLGHYEAVSLRELNRDLLNRLMARNFESYQAATVEPIPEDTTPAVRLVRDSSGLIEFPAEEPYGTEFP